MERLKSVGFAFFGLALILGFAALGGIIFLGVALMSAYAFPFINWISQIALLLSIFVFLPLALFRSTRIVAAFGLLAASYAFGACVWVFGLLVTWEYWGLLAVFLGMFVAGIGVVPLGMIASAFKSDWTAVTLATVGLMLTFGSRALAMWLGEKVDRYNLEQRMKIIDA